MNLSIIISTLNRTEVLKETLDFLIAEITSSELADKVEIIVIDNGSKEDFDSIYVEDNKRHLAFSKNRHTIPVYKNLQKGLTECNGRYVWFFGDDDLVNTGFISWLNEFILNNNVNMISLNRKSFNFLDEIQLDYVEPSLHYVKVDHLKERVRYFDRIFGFITSNIYERSALSKVFDDNKDLQENNYFNKYYSWLIAKKYGFLYLENIKAYKRESIGKGSYFQENPHIRLQTFVYDQLDIAVKIRSVDSELGKILIEKHLSDAKLFIKLKLEGIKISVVVRKIKRTYGLSLIELKYLHLVSIIPLFLLNKTRLIKSRLKKWGIRLTRDTL